MNKELDLSVRLRENTAIVSDRLLAALLIEAADEIDQLYRDLALAFANGFEARGRHDSLEAALDEVIARGTAKETPP